MNQYLLDATMNSFTMSYTTALLAIAVQVHKVILSGPIQLEQQSCSVLLHEFNTFCVSKSDDLSAQPKNKFRA